jgi:hypothetical protein
MENQIPKIVGNGLVHSIKENLIGTVLKLSLETSGNVQEAQDSIKSTALSLSIILTLVSLS